ncbi:major facilitator superfamily domain-containing protein, partial [Mycena olivaceomarginata]
MGTALSPNLAAFFVFRALTAFQGTSFLIIGTSCIGDIYRPTERGTALGWYLSGSLIGTALGPFIAGVIVTYRSWRVIFWLQTALGGLATVLVFFFQPETIHQTRYGELVGLSFEQKAARLWQMTNPFRVIKLCRYPNLIAASSALVWTQYSLLTPIRYIINPRFDLTTPIQSGLFYAPGLGNVAGTFVGGRWADRTVRKWIKNRGVRLPEDRLRSCIPFLGAVVPGSMLIYGWNVMQNRSAEAVATNYMARYLFAAVGSAVVLPAVEKIGVGWFSTISSVFLVLSAVGVHCTVFWGKSWRDKIDERRTRPETEKAASLQAAAATPDRDVDNHKEA